MQYKMQDLSLVISVSIRRHQQAVNCYRYWFTLAIAFACVFAFALLKAIQFEIE